MPAPVVGVIDESSPADRRTYTIALVTVPGDADDTRDRLRTTLGRKRPFHWVEDRGEVVRRRVFEVLVATGATVSLAVHADPDVDGVTWARGRLLRKEIVPWALALGVTEFLVERRSNAENELDRITLKRALRDEGVRRPYRWVDKSDPLTWLADAACGAWEDAAHGTPRWLGLLVEADALNAIQVRRPRNASAPGPRP